eukprot:m.710104 g.710104  ORF g.710104 m.710104 type:complete len:66 (+) comp58756_c0_seq4:234-431(+)
MLVLGTEAINIVVHEEESACHVFFPESGVLLSKLASEDGNLCLAVQFLALSLHHLISQFGTRKLR